MPARICWAVWRCRSLPRPCSLAGLALLARPVTQEDFGWVAYAPLATGPVVLQGLMIMGPWIWAGVALISIGLLLLAFWSGYRTGRQARDRGDDSR